jgi:hypothetical protein
MQNGRIKAEGGIIYVYSCVPQKDAPGGFIYAVSYNLHVFPCLLLLVGVTCGSSLSSHHAGPPP